MTSLTLELLRKETGVFITESDYQVIQLDYLNCLKESDLQDTEYTAKVFCEEWAQEQETLGTFKQTKDGSIKYYIMDADDTSMTAAEYVKQLDMTSYHWENLARSYWKIFHDILDTGNVNRQLLTNILKEETISHEQIYQLQSAVKNRVYELVEEAQKNDK